MQKLIGIAVVMALVIAAVTVVLPVGAGSENGLVYSSILDETFLSQHTLDRGEVKAWADGKVKVEIKVSNATDQTYNVLLEWGPPHARKAAKLGEITTDEKGHAIKFFDLDDLMNIGDGLPSSSHVNQPGFVISKRVAPPPDPPVGAFVPAIPYDGP